MVISTPATCGTTWVQMLCALLVFRGVRFDRRLTEVARQGGLVEHVTPLTAAPHVDLAEPELIAWLHHDVPGERSAPELVASS